MIMTSNIGADDLLESMEENGDISEEALERVQAKLRMNFRPEFLNRLDEIVMFKPLTKDNIAGIVDLIIADLNKRIADKEISIAVTDEAKTYIVENGYDPTYGARPLKRYVQKNVETLLARKILAGEVQMGDVVTIDVTGEGLTARVKNET